MDNEEGLDLEEVLHFIRDAQEQRRNKFGVSGMANYAIYETRNRLPPPPDDMQIDWNLGQEDFSYHVNSKIDVSLL